MILFLSGWAANKDIFPNPPKVSPLHRHDFSEKVSAKSLSESLLHICPQGGLHLIGWSLGGMMALELAAKYPEKIKELTIISSTAKFINDKNYNAGIPASSLKWLKRQVNHNASTAQLAFYQTMFSAKEKAAADIFATREPMVKSTAALLAGLEYLQYSDLRSLLSAITVKVKIIHGTADTICPLTAGIYLAEHLPNCELFTLPDCGHIPFLTENNLCNKIIWGN